MASRAEHGERPGHAPTVLAAFLLFGGTSMLWVLLGALGIRLSQEAGLSPASMGVVVAAPVLSGSLLRIPTGLLGDRYGARRVGAALLLLLLVPLALGWRGGDGLAGLLAVGLLLGVAGASFAVALPLASRWYPVGRQGLVLGVVAAGNTGTVVTHLVAPRLAERIGWHAVLGWSILPLLALLAVFLLLAREQPRAAAPPPVRAYLAILRERDLWALGGLYAVTFGGFVGLGSFLPLLLRDRYAATAVAAGSLTAAATLVGGLTRPGGGYLADRVAGARLLAWLMLALAALYAVAGSLPRLGLLGAALCGAMLCMGLGNGAVFQLVPRRFPDRIGVATGVVGALGGLGGCLLPLLLGAARERSGSYGPGFAVLAAAALAAALLLRRLSLVSAGWRTSWGARPDPAPTAGVPAVPQLAVD